MYWLSLGHYKREQNMTVYTITYGIVLFPSSYPLLSMEGSIKLSAMGLLYKYSYLSGNH